MKFPRLRRKRDTNNERDTNVTNTTDTKTPPSREVAMETIKDDFLAMIAEGRPETEAALHARLRQFEADVTRKVGFPVKIREESFGFVLDARLPEPVKTIDVNLNIDGAEIADAVADAVNEEQAAPDPVDNAIRSYENGRAEAFAEVAKMLRATATSDRIAGELLCRTNQHVTESALKHLADVKLLLAAEIEGMR